MIIKAQVICPCCAVAFDVPAVLVNRVVLCSTCFARFYATPTTEIVKAPDLRFIAMLCAVQKTSYTLMFHRFSTLERYAFRHSRETVEDKGVETATPEVFSLTDFNFSKWLCEGCGSNTFLCCCKIPFCAGRAVDTKNGRYAACPACGTSGYYTGRLKELRGHHAPTATQRLGNGLRRLIG